MDVRENSVAWDERCWEGCCCTGRCYLPYFSFRICCNLGEEGGLENIGWLSAKLVICVLVRRNKHALSLLTWSKFYLWNLAMTSLLAWKERMVHSASWSPVQILSVKLAPGWSLSGWGVGCFQHLSVLISGMCWKRRRTYIFVPCVGSKQELPRK